MTSAFVRSDKWHGVFTALVTPFSPDGKIDLKSFRDHLKRQKEAGVAGVIPCGTTGESPTLNESEKKLLIETAVQELKGSSVKVIAGTGTNDTQTSIDLSRWACSIGADAVLLVTPYYNKPSQAGLIRHFTAVADAISCDAILYNVPGRTITSPSAETIAKLALHPRITALKEASGNIAFVSESFDQLANHSARLNLLSGDDLTFWPFLCSGGSGIISVASNVIPMEMNQIYQCYVKGNWEEGLRLHQRLYPFFRDLFIDSNPVPVKAIMAHWNWCQNVLRLPLVALIPQHWEKLFATLKRCGLPN